MKLLLIGLARMLIFVAVVAACLFLSAGRWDWGWGWAYVGVYAASLMTAATWAFRRDPAGFAERMKKPSGGRQPYFRALLAPLVIAHWVVAGLDAGRYRWSGELPWMVQAAGLALTVAAISISAWATAVNRFFVSDVRIQTERGHCVVSDGPYRFVRHPGYLAVLVVFVAGPLALGSYWSALPLVPAVAMFLHRANLEDAMLRAELPGYADYAARVRYRLLPGVW